MKDILQISEELLVIGLMELKLDLMICCFSFYCLNHQLYPQTFSHPLLLLLPPLPFQLPLLLLQLFHLPHFPMFSIALLKFYNKYISLINIFINLKFNNNKEYPKWKTYIKSRSNNLIGLLLHVGFISTDIFHGHSVPLINPCVCLTMTE